ncbi:MAG: hypothetical protein J2P48_01770 [Alphaproteobacteria bacterium]|nr:hypothetical protein [Alphaproteobacteria bacterium]
MIPAAALRVARDGTVRHGQQELELEQRDDLAQDDEPVETRRGLPGNPDDTQSHRIEAAISAQIIGCLYPPNGNRWTSRLLGYVGLNETPGDRSF